MFVDCIPAGLFEQFPETVVNMTNECSNDDNECTDNLTSVLHAGFVNALICDAADNSANVNDFSISQYLLLDQFCRTGRDLVLYTKDLSILLLRLLMTIYLT